MNGSDQTILLVDDDANELFLLKRAFQKANVTNSLRVARDGQEAIDYLSRQGSFAGSKAEPLPALMLLDLKMPRKNGFEVLEWVRQQPGLRRMVVVVLTSSNLMADIKRAYDLGANSYLVKPVDFESLVKLVQALDAYWFLANHPAEPGYEAEDGPVPQIESQAA